MSWHQASIDRLRQLGDAGFSASEIAKRLTREFCEYFSRNAVIGKVHRSNGALKLSVPAGFPLPENPKPPPVKKLRVPSPRPIAQTDEQRSYGVELVHLRLRHCRWPIGDPVKFFCGRRTQHGKPYCPDHCRKAYKPGTK